MSKDIESEVGRVKIFAFKCERCGHKWVPRFSGKPKVCPKCKSPYWDTVKGQRKKREPFSFDIKI